MKKLLLLLLALPMLAAAQEKRVRVEAPCNEGSAFTISIPFKLPPEADTAWYRWYFKGALVDSTARAATRDNLKIAYTIPADSAYGVDVEAYFDFWLNDECCGKWTRSPVYVMTFEQPCVPPDQPTITISGTGCSPSAICAGTICGYSVSSVSGVSYKWTYPSGWSQIYSSTNMIALTPGTSGGTISVTPTITATGCVGETQTLAVTVNPAPTAPTTVDFSCSSYVTAMFTASGSTGGSGALSYLWSTSTSPTSGTWTALTTSATLTTTSTSYYLIAQDANGCRSAVSSAVAASRPTVPTTIDYSCSNNQSATFTASGSTGGSGALSYRWSETTSPNPTTGTWNALSTTKTLTTTSTSYYLLAQDTKNCRSNPSSTAVAASLPAQPSAVTGNSIVCASSTGNTYSVTSVANTTYLWTRPSGWTQTAGSSTNSITVTAGTTSGNIVAVPIMKGCYGSTSSTLAVSAVTCGNPTSCVSNTGTVSTIFCNGITSAGTISFSP